MVARLAFCLTIGAFFSGEEDGNLLAGLGCLDTCFFRLDQHGQLAVVLRGRLRFLRQVDEQLLLVGAGFQRFQIEESVSGSGVEGHGGSPMV